MKNFSEATATRPDLTLKVVLDLEAVGICPCQIKINDRIEFFGDLVGTNTLIHHLPLIEPIDITITVDRQRHPQAVKILRLTIDGNEIMPLYLDQSIPPTNYLDFTGTWTLKIPTFYPWYHAITGQGWVA